MRLFIVVILLLPLSSCAEAPISSAPAFGDAQSTLAAGEEELRSLAIQSTKLALDLTQAAATEAAFLQETVQAQNATATAQVEEHTATQQVIQATATAQELQTLTAAQTQAAHATHTTQIELTATAWPQTATPLAATQAAVVAAAIQTERRLYWSQYVVPFWVFIGAVVLVLLVVAIGYAFKRLLPVLELRARTIISPDGEMITFLPASNEIKAILPGRSAGPALHSHYEQSRVSGLAPDLSLQDRTLERHQATRLAATLPPGRSRRAAQGLLTANTPILTTEEEHPAPFLVVQSGERPPLLDSETLDILEGQWREVDE